MTIKYVVLESRRENGPWNIRNSRISHRDNVNFNEAKGIAEAERQAQGWAKSEPGTQFRIRSLTWEQFQELGIKA
jgi:hypothetical protein